MIDNLLGNMGYILYITYILPWLHDQRSPCFYRFDQIQLTHSHSSTYANQIELQPGQKREIRCTIYFVRQSAKKKKVAIDRSDDLLRQ